MNVRRHIPLLVVLIAILPLVMACESVTEPPAVGTISISAGDQGLLVGATVQLISTVLSPTGSVIPGHPVTWNSSAPELVSVNSSGLATALDAGVVTVTAAAGGESASVTLTVERGPCTSGTMSGAIALGQSIDGALHATDCLFEGVARADGYRLTLGESGGVRLALSANGFPPLLVVTDVQLRVLWWGSGQTGGAAHIERNIPAGEYIVWVFAESGGGAYALSAAPVTIVLCQPVGSLTLGQQSHGVLASSGCSDMGRYMHPWTLVVSAPTTVRIDLTSSHFDTFLILQDQHGAELAMDDDGGSGLNSMLVRVLAPGSYRVVVTSYGTGETGQYQLLAQASVGSAPSAAFPTLGAGASFGATLRKR